MKPTVYRITVWCHPKPGKDVYHARRGAGPCCTRCHGLTRQPVRVLLAKTTRKRLARRYMEGWKDYDPVCKPALD